MFKYSPLALLLLGTTFGAPAQTATDASTAAQEIRPPRWGVGVAVVANDNQYAGQGSRITPFPAVTYQGDRFYFFGITAGWRFINTETFQLAAVTSLRFDGFDVEDLGREELARNGLDESLLDDRDDGIDVGLSASWTGAAGELELEILTDVSGASEGQEASLKYGYPFQWGKTRITPSVGVSHRSKDLANYYFGTLDEEVARGVVDYKPGSVTVPQVGVFVTRPIGRKWRALGSVTYSSFPDELKDSPLLEPDSNGSTSLLLAITRNF
jgi:outer membrane protein